MRDFTDSIRRAHCFNSPSNNLPNIEHLFTAARILLRLIFLVFSLNYWLQFTRRAGARHRPTLGLSPGRYVHLALILLGPIIISIALFHIFVAPGNYGLAIVICVLGLVAVIGQKNYIRAIFAK
jgi:uncharacterized membrane protein